MLSLGARCFCGCRLLAVLAMPSLGNLMLAAAAAAAIEYLPFQFSLLLFLPFICCLDDALSCFALSATASI
ncbi:hypothetical protein MAM1_0958c11386 [Mucor ambiguus]|uniref:Uncharacterized protein n=1 Tax=Mucor ambiguus TaxID=91626 RepID=A0A0C9MM13_9FUNG|nr:hypothetical protein MAM1_0958c11386 [Mucor ambiguus]